MFDFTREQTIRSVEQSLERLGVEYIDLIQVNKRHFVKNHCILSIQVHDVEFCHDLRQITDYTLPALLEMKAQGKVRYIGLTGYSLDTIIRLVELLPPGDCTVYTCTDIISNVNTSGTVDCVLTYCRSTLIDQTLLGSALSFFKSRDIGVMSGVTMMSVISTVAGY